MLKIRILIFLNLILLTSCCTYFYSKPTLYNSDNNSSALKLDGYYYYREYISQGENKSYNFTFLFLYTNGVVYGFYTPSAYNVTGSLDQQLGEIDQYIQQISNLPITKYHLKSIGCWGSYNISNDSIEIKKIGCRFAEGLNTYKGYIKNDTTFTLTHYTRTLCASSTDNVVESINKEYYYRRFSPKPDSVNLVTVPSNK